MPRSRDARAYIDALRVFDAAAPTAVGYGFGGMVAFEMARLLIEANAEVPLLVLLASEPPAANSALGFLAGAGNDHCPRCSGKKTAEESNGRRRMQDTPAFRANQEPPQICRDLLAAARDVFARLRISIPPSRARRLVRLLRRPCGFTRCRAADP